MSKPLKAHSACELIDLIGVHTAIGNNTAKSNLVVFGLCTNSLNNTVHGKNGVEVVGRNNKSPFGMLQGRCKAATDHIAKHIKNNDIGFIEKVMFFQQLDGLTDHITAAACTRGWTTCLDAHHAVIALVDKVFDAQLLTVKLHRLQNINNGGHEFFRKREGGVMLGVAANLQDTLTQLRKGCR